MSSRDSYLGFCTFLESQGVNLPRWILWVCPGGEEMCLDNVVEQDVARS